MFLAASTLWLVDCLPMNAFAQGVDCNGLRADIAELSQADPVRTAQYDAAVQRQKDEIARISAYAKSIGCDRKQFLFFGEAPPPQCPQINAQIARMNGNLQQLQAQSSSGIIVQRQELAARFQTYCTANGAPRPPQGLAGIGNAIQSGLGLGGALSNQPPQTADTHPLQNPLQNPWQTSPQNLDATPQLGPDGQPLEPALPGAPTGGAVAVCVRANDGGFFPISYSASRARYDSLNELCHALCPNAQTTLYTYGFGRDIATAVSVDGAPYINHPNAFKYRKSFDEAASCKPEGQTWAQALADAERRLGRDGKSDVIVTVAKAAELSRPQDPKDPKSTVKDKKSNKADLQKAISDEASASDNAILAQVPTASSDSAGISANDLQSATSFGLGQGQTRELTEKDGTKLKIRVVGPKL